MFFPCHCFKNAVGIHSSLDTQAWVGGYIHSDCQPQPVGKREFSMTLSSRTTFLIVHRDRQTDMHVYTDQQIQTDADKQTQTDIDRRRQTDADMQTQTFTRETPATPIQLSWAFTNHVIECWPSSVYHYSCSSRVAGKYTEINKEQPTNVTTKTGQKRDY